MFPCLTVSPAKFKLPQIVSDGGGDPHPLSNKLRFDAVEFVWLISRGFVNQVMSSKLPS